MDSHKRSWLFKISTFIIYKLESSFFWYGKTIAQSPVYFILFCLFITSLCSVGLIRFTLENRPFKLWIPQESDFIQVMEWQIKNFPMKFRPHVAIHEAENVLKRDIILEVFKIHTAVTKTYTKDATWRSTCAKLPVISQNYGRKKRDLKYFRGSERKLHREKRQSWLVLPFMSQDDYCELLNNSHEECMEHSILEIWGYDEAVLKSLSDQDILDDINKVSLDSKVFGIPTNFTKFLGGIERNEKGMIVGAKAMQHIWITEIDEEEVRKGNYIDDEGTGMEVDVKGMDWERELIKTVLNDTDRLDGLNVYLMAMSSFGFISGTTIKGDARYLGLGFFIVFIYVQVMLGKFNIIEQRPLLSLLGISCVGLATCVSYGICSVLNVPYGPVNNVLPFLLLGLGVDDMFVFIQSWNNLSPEERTCNLDVRVGYALKHAGVSITITSLTDFVAFAIGCTTVLPALRYFCLYAAIGIISIYFFQATFFVAWFTLDQRRLEDKRQGLFWCIKLKNWEVNKCSQKDLCHLFFKDIFSKILLHPVIKVLVIILTFGLLGVSGWGLSNLEQEFSPIWFLPQSSYLFKFFTKLEEYFPSDGDDSFIYFGDLNLLENINKVDQLVHNLNKTELVSEIDSWTTAFKEYLGISDYSSFSSDYSEEEFSTELGEFLYSPYGSKYRLKNFNFNGTINCTDPAPPVYSFSIEYKHIILHGTRNKTTAMDTVKEIVKDLNISGYAKPWARVYSTWETDKIIELELYRNLSMAMIVVGLMTLALIASVTTSFMVLLCVVMTLIDVGALMHWWGLTIDTVSCIDLVLAVGLCVDYAAHVGHTFMTQKGSRNQRARDTLAKIGPAVLNGGFSTFLAFCFLAGSDSHVFITFFKIFFAVCLYGLYHGLVFLPVILSILGPAPYESALNEKIQSSECVEDVQCNNHNKNMIDTYDVYEDECSLDEKPKGICVKPIWGRETVV